MELEDTDIYASLKVGKNKIAGKVKSLHDGELVFHAASEDRVPLLSFQRIDVFTKRHIYFRNLPVIVVADENIAEEKFYSKMITRKIRVRYHNSEVASFITRIIAV